MKTLIQTWLTGWRVIGRLLLFGIAWWLFGFLVSALGGWIENKTICVLLGIAVFVCLAPLVAYRAAAVSRVCRDIVDEDQVVQRDGGSDA